MLAICVCCECSQANALAGRQAGRWAWQEAVYALAVQSCACCLLLTMHQQQNQQQQLQLQQQQQQQQLLLQQEQQ